MAPPPTIVDRLILNGLDCLSPSESDIEWKPFREGVTIHRLYGDGVTGPFAALLQYIPGARIPMHEHRGYEHIYVLSGSQSDGTGHYEKGTLVIHKPGTQHEIYSEEGCIVLAIYEKPVRFL